MDVDVARWILEFLLRQQSLDDRTVNHLISILPHSDNDLGLEKRILLSEIEKKLSEGTVSEDFLVLLEKMERLDHREGVGVSEAMKASYCAVAVDCTVRSVEGNDEGDVKGKYFSAVERIWRGRVCELENFGARESGLFSEELKSWKNEVEAGVEDSTVRKNLLRRHKGRDSVEIVRGYVHEAVQKLGPSFLELVAETLSDGEMREVFGLGNDGQPIKESVPGSCSAGRDVVANGDNKELHGEDFRRKYKKAAVRHPRGAVPGTSRGAKIIDTKEVNVATSHNGYDCLQTSEVNKVQEALEASSLELQAVVKDPLPDALHLAQNIKSSLVNGNAVKKPIVGNENNLNEDAPSSSLDGSAGTRPVNDGKVSNGCSRGQNNGTKPSLMERNSTARTFEWEDSIESSAEGSDRRPHLPTPKNRVVSPLKKNKFVKLSRRRKVRRWSTLEEDTLRTGVQKYGKGHWKLILSMYPDIFEERTEVDLKDKWRNMVRY